MSLHPFDRDLVMIPGTDPQRLTLDISDQWSINNTPNGGYIMALMLKGLRHGFGVDTAACITTANYLDRCIKGPAVLELETMGESTTYLRRQARLIQNGRERIRAWGTLLRREEPGVAHESAPADPAPLDQCTPVPFMEGYTLYKGVDLRLDPESSGWMTGRTGSASCMKGWIRFHDERELDLAAITLFCDSFPPCVFTRHGMNAWVPTLEYSVNIRQLPQSPWLKGHFQSRFLSAGLVEEDGELWDEAGNLIAISRQVAKYQIPA